MDLVEFGWIWLDPKRRIRIYFGRPRQCARRNKFQSCGWLNLVGFGWIWLDLVEFGWIWLSLVGFGWIRSGGLEFISGAPGNAHAEINFNPVVG